MAAESWEFHEGAVELSYVTHACDTIGIERLRKKPVDAIPTPCPGLTYSCAYQQVTERGLASQTLSLVFECLACETRKEPLLCTLTVTPTLLRST